MKIVGMIGQKGHGKDTAAAALLDIGWLRKSFAEALYLEVAQAYGVSVEFLQNRDTKEVPLPELAPVRCQNAEFREFLVAHWEANGETLDLTAPMSPRVILQLWGTDFRRRTADGYWRDQVRDAILRGPADACWVLTDVRFPDEAELLRTLAPTSSLLLRIVRPALLQVTAGDTHASETAMAAYPVDVLLVNDENNVEALKRKVVAALRAAENDAICVAPKLA